LFSEATEADSDDYFSNAMREAGNVVLAESHEYQETPAGIHESWIRPLQQFVEASAATAIVKLPIDIDGAVRQAFLSFDSSTQERFLPAFSYAIADLFLKKSAETEQEGAISSAQLQGLFGNTDPILINYTGPPRTIPTVSYYQAIEPETYLSKDFFKNKVVLVGLSLTATVELKKVDSYEHPFVAESGLMAGVEIHGNVLDTLLRQRFLNQASDVMGYWLFAGQFIVALAVLYYFGHLIGALFFISVLVVYWLSALWLFMEVAYFIPVVTPIIALLLFLLMDKIYGVIVEDRQKRFISKAFKNYVSPAVVDQLVTEPERLKLSGEYAETTVIFTDLAGFTSIAEKMEPMKLRRLLTQYFTKMIDIMQENNGTLDKLIGDAIMCFFGVPIATPEHHLQAARTAWGMQLALKELNKEWVKLGLPELGMRIGVNSGQVVAGNIGTDTLFNYTIMGDCVNLGARLESANKFYGTNLMVGEATQPYIKDEFELRQLDLVKVKGKDKAVAIYEMLGPKGQVAEEKLQNRKIYETALNHYFQGDFEQAAALFQENIDDFQDSAAVLLLERCQVLIKEPPQEWHGVYAWTSK